MAQSPAKPADTSPGGGKITRDARGNAVWAWVSETGKIAIDSTSRLLKRLDTSDLELEGGDKAAPTDAPATPHKTPAAASGHQGYDPYSAKPMQRKATPRPHPIPPAPLKGRAAGSKKSFLSRLLGRK